MFYEAEAEETGCIERWAPLECGHRIVQPFSELRVEFK